MKPRIIDLRSDETTAERIADALRLQTQFGYEHAREFLHALGIESQLAQRLLAIRYDRRAADTAANSDAEMHRKPSFHSQLVAAES